MSIDSVGEHLAITLPPGVRVKILDRLEVIPARPAAGPNDERTHTMMRLRKLSWPIFDGSSWHYIYWDKTRGVDCSCGGPCDFHRIHLVESTLTRRRQRTAVALCIGVNSYVVMALCSNVRHANNMAIARNVASERRAERRGQAPT